MAKKITLAELDINVDKAIAGVTNLRKQETALKSKLDEVVETEGKVSAEYVKTSAELKTLQNELRTEEKLLVKTTAESKGKVGTLAKLENANAKLRAEQSKLNLETSKGRKRNQEINKEINKNTETISKNSDKRKQNTMNIGNYTSAMGESGVAVNAATSAMQTFGTVLKVMLGPLGLVIAAIAALTSYFKRSEEGQNSLAKSVAVFQTVLQNLLDILGKVGEGLFNAITKPRKAWEDFKDFVGVVGEFFKNTFGNVIGGAIEAFVGIQLKAFAKVGLAWQKFKGLFVDNADKINSAQQKIEEYDKKIEDGQKRLQDGAKNLKEGVVSAYNSAKKSVSEFAEEQKKEIEIAKGLADQRAALDKLERKNKVETAKEILKLNELKNAIEDKVNRTAEERLQLLEEENSILDTQRERQLLIVQGNYELKKTQNELSASTKEDLEEEANLLANVYTLQATIEAQRKQMVAKRNEVTNQLLAEQRILANSSVDTMQYELNEFIALNEGKINITRQTAERQKNILKAALDVKISEIDAQENISEAAKNAKKLKLNEDYQLKVTQLNVAFEEKERVRRLKVLQEDYANESVLAENNIFSQLDIQKKQNDLQRAEEIRNAKLTGASVHLINKKYDKADEELEKAKIDAKLSLAQGFASNIATIAGENTKVGKAAAVAATTIETFKGAQSAFSALAPIPIVGPVLGIAAAAAAVAAGIANVKKILAVKPSVSSSISASGSVPATTTSSATSTSTSQQPSLTSTLQNVNTTLGQGIVSREINGLQSEGNAQVIPTLVVDDVTNKQIEADLKTETSTI